MTLALPYVFEVPAGPEQDEVVESIRHLALNVSAAARVEAFRHPLGMVRVRMAIAGFESEEIAAAVIAFSHIPKRVTVFARP